MAPTLVNSVSGPSISAGSLAFILSEVRGLYDYHSQGPDELDVSEGARIELTSGPSGGQNYAEGWWEGQLKHHARFESFHTNLSVCFSGIDALGRKGIFPSNYVGAHLLSSG